MAPRSDWPVVVPYGRSLCTKPILHTTTRVQALRHGISRALQLWEPELRPALKQAGLLTRDSRIVERKKPGRWVLLKACMQAFFSCLVMVTISESW